MGPVSEPCRNNLHLLPVCTQKDQATWAGVAGVFLVGHWARMAGVQKTVGAVGLTFNIVTNVSSFFSVWLINIVCILHPFSPLS